MIAGIDEAGRGPLIGPLFIALCISESATFLESLNIKDSKIYGSSLKAKNQRALIFNQIRSTLQTYWIEIPANTIDEFILKGPGLNRLEQTFASFLFGFLPPKCPIIADGQKIFEPLKNKYMYLDALNKADEKYPIVSASSIVAKHMRDTWMKQYENFIESKYNIKVAGGGYVNKHTIDFVDKFKNQTGRMPPELRKSWKLKSKNLTLF